MKAYAPPACVVGTVRVRGALPKVNALAIASPNAPKIASEH